MLNEYTGFFVCLFACLFFNARLEQSKYAMIIFLHLKIKSETKFLTQKISYKCSCSEHFTYITMQYNNYGCV